MSDKTLILMALLSGIGMVCLVFIAGRLQQHAREREEAERRAAEALEELTRFGAELRARREQRLPS